VSLSKKAMFSATLSNYIHLIIKIIVSLILVRIMFLGMGQENYGFWALLWSIFGYSVLLEFGLGVTIQKKSAEFMAAGEINKISSLFSTYLLVYFIISLIIITTTVLLSFHLDTLFVIADKHKLEEYRLALLIFGIGSAISFSLGFADEILRGFHLLRIRNHINTVFILLNALLLWQCVVWEQPIYIYALVAVSVQALNNLSFFIVLKRKISNLEISLKLVDFSEVKGSMKFSLSAYLVMFSNIIIFRTDQIIISVIAGVTFAGFYQIAARISELFRQFATQFHESLSTKAALLHKDHDKDELSQLLIHSNKLISAIATLLFIPAYILIEPLLFQWLDLKDTVTIDVAKILLISMYVLVVFRSSMVNILLMNDQHTQLMKVGLLEALINVILSIILVHQYGMIGAAIGTLIPNILFALFYNIPVSLKYTSISFITYCKTYLLPLAFSFTVVFYMGNILVELIVPNTLLKLCLDGFILLLCFATIYGLLSFKKELLGKFR
jgi:O-antigen/teichoic acid export membrane protein